MNQFLFLIWVPRWCFPHQPTVAGLDWSDPLEITTHYSSVEKTAPPNLQSALMLVAFLQIPLLFCIYKASFMDYGWLFFFFFHLWVYFSKLSFFFLVDAFTRYFFCINNVVFSWFNLLVFLLKENLMETSYTDLEGLEGAAYQDPKISDSFADPLFWAVLCIYLHFEYQWVFVLFF